MAPPRARTEGSKKECTNCHEMKELTEFYKNNTTYDGRTTQCAVCLRERQKERYRKDPEKCLKGSREWYQQNRERHYQSSLAWKRANPEKHREHVKRSKDKKKNETE